MKIQKFEKYSMDMDNGDIAEEYAKLIISQFIDTDEKFNLEGVFIDTIKIDNLDEDNANMIKQGMINYLEYLLICAKKIRMMHEIDAEKYNV